MPNDALAVIDRLESDLPFLAPPDELIKLEFELTANAIEALPALIECARVLAQIELEARELAASYNAGWPGVRMEPHAQDWQDTADMAAAALAKLEEVPRG